MKNSTVEVPAQAIGPLSQFWQAHYDSVAAQSTPWLDYSNHRVQLQSLAAAADAAGEVLGLTCLDAGCGWGQLSLALQAFGAAQVTGVDLNGAMIEELRTKYPTLRWGQGSISDAATFKDLGQFDRVFALEVLQYVALDSCLPHLWRSTRPGGRVIALVPNRDCPIVGKTVERFSGQYAALPAKKLKEALSALEGVDFWAVRGLWFREDQRIAPYELSSWTTDVSWETPPNRLLFVAQRG